MPEHPPHPRDHKPPHIREKNALAKSLVLSSIFAVVFFVAMNYLSVPLGGSVPASVALWTGLAVILAKLM